MVSVKDQMAPRQKRHGEGKLLTHGSLEEVGEAWEIGYTFQKNPFYQLPPRP